MPDEITTVNDGGDKSRQPVTDITNISQVPDSYTLVTGGHERNRVLEHIKESPDDYSHGSLFVDTGEGEYTDVLFFGGNVPYLYKGVTQVI